MLILLLSEDFCAMGWNFKDFSLLACIFQFLALIYSNTFESIIQIQMKEQISQEIYLEENLKKYKRVTNHAKNKLIQKVVFEGKKVASIAKVLRINPSTAKMIILRYKKKMNAVKISPFPQIQSAKQIEEPQKDPENSKQKIKEFEPMTNFPGCYIVCWMPIVTGMIFQGTANLIQLFFHFLILQNLLKSQKKGWEIGLRILDEEGGPLDWKKLKKNPSKD